MSAADAPRLIRNCAADLVEIAAYRASPVDLNLPALGRIEICNDQLRLSVRPGRWLLLSDPVEPGAAAANWQSIYAESAAAVDLSSGLTVLWVQGSTAREMLGHGCRLDLDAGIMPVGSAAATLIAQVAVTLVMFPAGVLLLTPSTTARHFREWLVATAQAFGFAPGSDVQLTDLLRSEGR